MAYSIYEASVPVYARMLTALSATLGKAAAHADEKKIKQEAYTAARLFPDMWSLAEQVRAACNHATRGPARIAGLPVPTLEGKDATFADLQARIEVVLQFLAPFTAEQFAGAEDREVVFPAGNSERRMSGRAYLQEFSMPNFMFHATTAYAILRHNGVPLRKSDFLGE